MGREKKRERKREGDRIRMYTICIQNIIIYATNTFEYLVNFKLYVRDDNNKVWSLPLTC
jgi:hypothetical protein